MSEFNIDFRNVVRKSLSEKWRLLAILLFFLFTSVVYLWLAKDIYRAEIVLVTAEARQNTNSLTSQLGGAAALIGLNIENTYGGQITSALAILQSREFIRNFIQEENILVPLFAGDWSPEVGRIIDSSIYEEATNVWKLPNGAPTDLMAYRVFSRMLRVSVDQNAGVIRITLDWRDPAQAADWLNLIVKKLNQDLKESDLEEANNAIAYLRRQLQITQLVEMQQVFYQLIESQIRITMLADVRDEYVLRVIDPAVTPDQPISPRKVLVISLGMLSGLFFSAFYLFLRIAIGQSSNKK